MASNFEVRVPSQTSPLISIRILLTVVDRVQTDLSELSSLLKLCGFPGAPEQKRGKHQGYRHQDSLFSNPKVRSSILRGEGESTVDHAVPGRMQEDAGPDTACRESQPGQNHTSCQSGNNESRSREQ